MFAIFASRLREAGKLSKKIIFKLILRSWKMFLPLQSQTKRVLISGLEFVWKYAAGEATLLAF